MGRTAVIEPIPGFRSWRGSPEKAGDPAFDSKPISASGANIEKYVASLPALSVAPHR